MVKSLALTLAIVLLLVGCSPTPKVVEKIVERTRLVVQAVIVPQTVVVKETVLVEVARPQVAIATPLMTETSLPAATDTPLPPTPSQPARLSGSGDAVVDFDNPFTIGVAHITGNKEGRHFAVESYGKDGEGIDLLVNATDPYDGVRPLDFRGEVHTTRFVVKAPGKWEIEIASVWAVRSLAAPGSIKGKGDDVIALVGSKPDKAKITGNKESRYFAVSSYVSLTGR